MSESLRSVVIYLATFGASLFFFMLSERQYARVDAASSDLSAAGRKVKGRVDGHIWAFLGILSLCLLAALRAETVGVDTSNYPVHYMAAAVLYQDFWSMLSGPISDFAAEPLNAALVWFCSRFTRETGALLFFYQLFTVLPVFLAAYRMRDRAPLTMAMAVYIFFFFNNSLNMMRQSVSCALLLLAVVRVLRAKRVSPKDVLIVVAAILFHRSGIYGLLLLAVASAAFVVDRRWIKVVIVVAVVAFPTFLSQVGEFLASNALIDSHMQMYFDVFVTGDVEKEWFVNPLGGYSLSYLVMYAALVFAPNILGSSFFSQDSPNGDEEGLRLVSYTGFLTKVGILLYTVLLFSLDSVYGGRFSLFLDFLLIVAIPLSCAGKSKSVKCLAALVLLVCVWFCWIIVLGWSGSSVYEFVF